MCNFFCLRRLRILDEIVSWTMYSCCLFVTRCGISSVSNNVNEVYCYLCVSALTANFYQVRFRRLGFTMPQCNISRFKIGFEFIKVQVNGCYLLYVRGKCKHFTELYRAVTERNLLVVLSYYFYGKYAPLSTLRRNHILLECSGNR